MPGSQSVLWSTLTTFTIFALLFAAPALAQEVASLPLEPVAEPAAASEPAAETQEAVQSDGTSEQAEAEYNKTNKSYFIPALEIIGFNAALNRFDRRFLPDTETFDVSWETVRRNLRGPWVVDADPFYVNQFLHPYHGSIYHTTARSAGLGFWVSSLYTIFGSTLWEIAGETESPSINDQIASGIGGAYFGEALFRMASLTLESNSVPRPLRVVGATAISPMTGLNRLIFGNRFDAIFPGHEPANFARLNFGATVAERRVAGTSRRERQNEGLLETSFAYGLPGKADYNYRRPFDYFNFEFAASSSNIFENIMTRGLLLGKEYGGGGGASAGVWGLYGSYDFIRPDVFRVSSTALSLGTTGQWRLPGPVTLQGTLLMGVGYGAGGTLEGTEADRDYNYGLTPQSLLTTRLIFGKVAALDLSARGYRITDVLSTTDGGWENVGRADAAFTVRLFGPHALTVKYLVSRRYASFPHLGVRDQRRDTISFFYTFMSDRNLGAVAAH
jgi:hypothetical protein